MTHTQSTSTWRFHHIGLFVTGKGESEFIGRFLRSLAQSGRCSFKVIAKVEQMMPRAASLGLSVVGTGGKLPTRLETMALQARGFLDRHNDAFVILIDDLERSRLSHRTEVFHQYRHAFDRILLHQRHRAAVHFLVNMLEAYYFADPKAVNAVLGTQLSPPTLDVELIRHPKGHLKALHPGFDEVRDGRAIVDVLELETVLSDPLTCKSLRALFKWCATAIGDEHTTRFRLADGECCPVTGSQRPTA